MTGNSFSASSVVSATNAAPSQTETKPIIKRSVSSSWTAPIWLSKASSSFLNGIKKLTFANLSWWNSLPPFCPMSWLAFHRCSAGEASSFPFVSPRDNVVFYAYFRCRPECWEPPTTHQSWGWLASLSAAAYSTGQALKNVRHKGMGTGYASRARRFSQLYLLGSTKVSGFPWAWLSSTGSFCWKSDVNQEPEKNTPPPFLSWHRHTGSTLGTEVGSQGDHLLDSTAYPS